LAREAPVRVMVGLAAGMVIVLVLQVEPHGRPLSKRVDSSPPVHSTSGVHATEVGNGGRSAFPRGPSFFLAE